MMKYCDICVTPLGNHTFLVIKDIYYKDIIITKGYPTNGANIPRIFWSIIPPNDSNILPAVIVHDYLCDNGLFTKADEYFKDIMFELGVNPIKTYTMYFSVRLFTLVGRPIRDFLQRIIHG